MEKSESIFINRELSWLDFDSRVLALAKEKTVPLGERLKFAAIFGSNMDEFFMVRVGSLYDQTLVKNNKTDNVTHMTAAEQIAAITPRVAELQAKCDKYFQHLVTALAQEGYRKVLAVCISGNLSGTCNLLRLLCDEYEGLECCVIDSKNISIGSGIIAIRCAQLLEEGMDFASLCQQAQQMIGGSKIFFCLKTLEYLQKGGRIGKVTGRAANMLGLKPMILFKDGEIFSGGVARGRQKSFEKALEQLMNYLDAHGGTPDDYRITVGYGYDADEGKRLWMQTRAALRAKYPGAQCEVGLLQIGCTIAVHTGPYALGMGVMRRWKKQG